ncbi:MAG: peptide chain release factor 1 [Bacilli bacterium]
MDDKMRSRLETMKSRNIEIEDVLSNSEIMSDMDRFRNLSKEKSHMEPIVAKYEEYLKAEVDRADSLFMIENESDHEMVEMAKDILNEKNDFLEATEEELKLMLVPKDPNDDKNIVVEIRGAVGGDEGNIFAGDLFRMYTRYAEECGWKIQILDQSPSEAGGFSFCSFMVKGDGVYSKLKFESGAHRVQRVPKTETAGRIHTSTATVLVMPEQEEIDISINPEDLHVDTYRSQGAGGQNVNKTESAVRITHVPTGLVVSCQTEKSQIQNRSICMTMLRAKMFAFFEQQQQEKIGSERKLKVGTGERSEKIRTYNYPQNRVTDHRIGFTVQKLDRVMEGDLEDIIEALINFDLQQKMLEDSNESK